MDAPTKLAFSFDGRAVTFLAATDGSNLLSLWRLDLAGGARRELLGPVAATDEATLRIDDVLRRERTRERALGVTDYHVADLTERDVVLAHFDGRPYLSFNGRPAAVIDALDDLQEVRLAPDARRIAWVRGGELFAADLTPDGALAGTRQCSNDAGDGVTNGLADYLAAEELGRHRGFWWSVDGGAIAYAHVDEREIPPFLIQHLAADPPRLETHRYSFPGATNPTVELRVVSIADGQTFTAALGMVPGDYLARVVTDPGGGWLVAILGRDQRRLRWVRVGSDGTAAELWAEVGEPWLNLDDHTRVLGDGRILRASETSGYRHLELRGADGSLERRLTDGPWVVTDIAAVDEQRDEILFVATRDSVLERHLYRVSLDAPRPVSAPDRLTAEPGWHEVVASRDGTRWIDRWSSVSSAPRVVVADRDGPIQVLHEPSASLAEIGIRAPILTTVTAADGITELQAAIYGPDAPASEPPPGVLWVYGGPHSQKVADSWELTVTLWRQLVAQLGCAVMVIDNRGTFDRGLAFEAAAVHRRLGRVELDDQVAAIDELAARGLVDPARIAITGDSYGGFMTIRAMLCRPERFRAGVAWAPVIDWASYDSAYTERYLGTPRDNPDGYRDSGLLEHAARLAGPLLIQHGMVDENVHLRHTIRFLGALNEAGIACELQLFPGSRHAARGTATLRSRDRRAIEFLCGALGVPLPAAWTGLATDPHR